MFWIYALIVVSGVLQAWGPPMNGALRVALVNRQPCVLPAHRRGCLARR